MKCRALRLVGGHGESPPSRGRGLKSFVLRYAKDTELRVAPLAGAWIEIWKAMRRQL